MPEVTAIASFDHNGLRNVGDRFPCSDSQARQLERKGLVTIAAAVPLPAAPLPPSRAAGASRSASPAAPVSPQTTAILSAAGVALKRTRRTKFGKSSP
jgi:hypothetical protein